MKKATLLIINIHKLYTAVSLTCVITVEDAYIGAFHDTIIEVGTGGYQHLIDKDTRILDVRGHIVVPGFIDASYPITLGERDKQRRLHEQCMNGVRHGVVSMAINHPKLEGVSPIFYYDVFFQPQIKQGYPIIQIEDILEKRLRLTQFCLSASQSSCDPLKSGQLLYLKEQASCYRLLKALTLYPARRLQQYQTGMLKAGMQADILVLNALDLEEVFSSLRDDLIFQVIKKGVRIYPNVII